MTAAGSRLSNLPVQQIRSFCHQPSGAGPQPSAFCPVPALTNGMRLSSVPKARKAFSSDQRVKTRDLPLQRRCSRCPPPAVASFMAASTARRGGVVLPRRAGAAGPLKLLSGGGTASLHRRHHLGWSSVRSVCTGARS